MKNDIFSPESHAHLCEDFVRRLDSPTGVPVETSSFLVNDFQKIVSNVVLEREIIYAHLLFGGEPLTSTPFINQPHPGDSTKPVSHKWAAHETAKHYQLEITDDDYWSLYVLRPCSAKHMV